MCANNVPYKLKKTAIPWTLEEKEILKRLWINPKVTEDNIRQVFKNRTWSGIIAQCKKLHLEVFNAYRRPEIDVAYYKKLLEIVEG